MRRTRALMFVVLTAGLGGVLSLGASQAVPGPPGELLIGVWVLDVAKSTYAPGPGPVSETRTYARGPNGVEGAIQRRFRDGRSERIEYIAEYDREYPVMGTDAYDHILLKRVDEQTAEAVLSHAGRVYATTRRVVARDGKTMTITFRREAGANAAVTNVAHYEKVEP